MKKFFLPLLLIPLLLSTSCSNNQTSSSISSIIKSPNEDGGLEGNADKDTIEAQDPTVLKEFLLKVATQKYYTYEVTANINGNKTHFINHTAPYAWYEESDNPANSFGYAEEINTGAVFKYYISDDGKNAIPSIYEYVGIGDSIIKLTGLYSPLTITHVNLFASNMDDFSAITQGTNKFLITDSNTASIFQFLTTYGNSITNFINSVYVEILDEENLKFKSTCDLGNYGTIEGIFTPTRNLKNSFVNDLVLKNELTGIDYHEDVNDFFTKVMPSNNFVLHGIKQDANVLEDTGDDPYTIHCTNDYFYLEYSKSLQAQGYQNFGYVYLPKNTTVTFKDELNSVPLNKTQTLDYSACYSFYKDNNGEFVMNKFIGPIESGIDYIEVDNLPETGKYNTYYIVEENGVKVAYEYREISDGVNGWALYDTWFNSVGDFPINGVMASFYVGSTALTQVGSLYFEQNLNDSNEYYSKDLSVIGVLANGLFGWGFQHTDTWMDYIEGSKLRVNKDSSNQVTSYEMCLDVFNNGDSKIHEISYEIDNFGKGNVIEVDNFINQIIGGAK